MVLPLKLVPFMIKKFYKNLNFLKKIFGSSSKAWQFYRYETLLYYYCLLNILSKSLWFRSQLLAVSWAFVAYAQKALYIKASS